MNIREKKILFADLDGTLIRVVEGKGDGSPFPKDVTDFRICKTVLDTIITEMPNLSHIEIVTNQGGVPEFYSKEEIKAKLTCIRDFIFFYINKDKKDGEAMISVAYQCCTSLDKNDPMRKPNPGMLAAYAVTRGNTKEEMLMMGDASGIHNEIRNDFSDSDKRCAENFGIDYIDVHEFLSMYPF